MTDHENTAILDAVRSVSESVGKLADKVDSGLYKVAEELTAMKVEHAKVATVVSNIKDSSTTLKRELYQLKDEHIRCAERMSTKSADDSRVVSVATQTTTTTESISDAFRVNIPKWMSPILLALMAVIAAALGISVEKFLL